MMYYFIIGAFALLLSFYPYFVWAVPFSPTGISTLILFFLFLLHFKIKKETIFFSFLITLLYVFLSLKGGYSIFGILSLLMLCMLFYTDKQFIADLFVSFSKIYAVLMGISFIMYIIVVILGISIPHTEIQALNPEKIGFVTYYKYPFLIVADSFNFLKYRFSGFFDEPGVVGTISAVSLLTNRFDLRKWYNIIILIVGIFSMSLYFIVLIFIFFFFQTSVKYKFLFGLVSIILLFLFSKSEVINDLLFRRFNLSNGSWDNRNHMATGWYEAFMNSPNYLVGYGTGASQIYNSGGSSYKNIIIDHGFIFFFSYVMIFVFYGMKVLKNNKDKFLYVVIFSSILFQRPYIDNVGYLFLMFAPICVLCNNDFDEK